MDNFLYKSINVTDFKILSIKGNFDFKNFTFLLLYKCTIPFLIFNSQK
ncbi:hypothetical protein HJ01_02650 [Flavobacterium frigoris PS1]|uniref:Uncharacterized protein n=1 Tax=Flavobacterium frigoris (strain PS1) TaxID=1086011 RepID=H7FUA4_FLAFP|nr:hypothetical protein HJ01_02650 [Flavobacterium frigoris PS1]